MTTKEIEKRIADDAGVYVAVEEDARSLTLSGLVGSEGERQAAIDIATELAPGKRIEDNMEVSNALPREIGGMMVAEGDAGAFQGSTAGLSQRGGLEAGDFTDQELMTDPLAASGAGSSGEYDEVAEGGNAYVPPIDPVGSSRRIIGGFETSSDDDNEAVERSYHNGVSDETLADAVRRELRESSATAGLDIQVTVREGIAHLRGHVFSMDDAEIAEDIASRVPGIISVHELLEVEAGHVR